MADQEKPVMCAGCGRSALQGNGVTAGGDTWWEVHPPFDVGEAAEQDAAKGVVDSRLVANVCSPDCAVRAIEKLRPYYGQLEEKMLNHPEHIYEGGKS